MIAGMRVVPCIGSFVFGLRPEAFRSRPCNKNVNLTPTPIIYRLKSADPNTLLQGFRREVPIATRVPFGKSRLEILLFISNPAQLKLQPDCIASRAVLVVQCTDNTGVQCRLQCKSAASSFAGTVYRNHDIFVGVHVNSLTENTRGLIVASPSQPP